MVRDTAWLFFEFEEAPVSEWKRVRIRDRYIPSILKRRKPSQTNGLLVRLDQ